MVVCAGVQVRGRGRQGARLGRKMRGGERRAVAGGSAVTLLITMVAGSLRTKQRLPTSLMGDAKGSRALQGCAKRLAAPAAAPAGAVLRAPSNALGGVPGEGQPPPKDSVARAEARLRHRRRASPWGRALYTGLSNLDMERL